jgi:hypothetical protein
MPVVERPLAAILSLRISTSSSRALFLMVILLLGVERRTAVSLRADQIIMGLFVVLALASVVFLGLRKP